MNKIESLIDKYKHLSIEIEKECNGMYELKYQAKEEDLVKTATYGNLKYIEYYLKHILPERQKQKQIKIGE